MRTVSEATRDRVLEGVGRVVEGVAAAHGGGAPELVCGRGLRQVPAAATPVPRAERSDWAGNPAAWPVAASATRARPFAGDRDPRVNRCTPTSVYTSMDPASDGGRGSREREVEALYRVHAARLTRLASLLLRDPEEAREVMQDVFVKAIRAADGPGRPQAWSPWLTRVTVNGCRDRHRSSWWRFAGKRRVPLEALDAVDLGPTPDREAASAETRERVWAVVRRLPARQREVFALRHFEGWSTGQIAESLGVGPGSVKRHLFRAVGRLRAALGERR